MNALTESLLRAIGLHPGPDWWRGSDHCWRRRVQAAWLLPGVVNTQWSINQEEARQLLEHPANGLQEMAERWIPRSRTARNLAASRRDREERAQALRRAIAPADPELIALVRVVATHGEDGDTSLDNTFNACRMAIEGLIDVGAQTTTLAELRSRVRDQYTASPDWVITASPTRPRDDTVWQHVSANELGHLVTAGMLTKEGYPWEVTQQLLDHTTERWRHAHVRWLAPVERAGNWAVPVILCSDGQYRFPALTPFDLFPFDEGQRAAFHALVHSSGTFHFGPTRHNTEAEAQRLINAKRENESDGAFRWHTMAQYPELVLYATAEQLRAFFPHIARSSDGSLPVPNPWTYTADLLRLRPNELDMYLRLNRFTGAERTDLLARRATMEPLLTQLMARYPHVMAPDQLPTAIAGETRGGFGWLRPNVPSLHMAEL